MMGESNCPVCGKRLTTNDVPGARACSECFFKASLKYENGVTLVYNPVDNQIHSTEEIERWW